MPPEQRRDVSKGGERGGERRGKIFRNSVHGNCPNYTPQKVPEEEEERKKGGREEDFPPSPPSPYSRSVARPPSRADKVYSQRNSEVMSVSFQQQRRRRRGEEEDARGRSLTHVQSIPGNRRTCREWSATTYMQSATTVQRHQQHVEGSIMEISAAFFFLSLPPPPPSPPPPPLLPPNPAYVVINLGEQSGSQGGKRKRRRRRRKRRHVCPFLLLSTSFLLLSVKICPILLSLSFFSGLKSNQASLLSLLQRNQGCG